MSTTKDRARPFGRALTAMVTPMTPDGGIDVDGVQRLATYLVDEGGNDGLIVNGTTGEYPTLSDPEKETVLRAAVEAVGDRATIVAGAGNNDTRHTLEVIATAQKAGAHGLLLVSPYYNKPPQEGLYRHFTAAANSSDLPVMLYDIPGRTGVAIETDTLVRLAEHPRILAVKDAKGDLAGASWVMARSGVAWYSGEDMLNLPLYSIGAVGHVSVVGHVVGVRLRDMLDAYERGDVRRAAELHQSLLPVYTGIFRTQGLILTKAALRLLGLPAGPVRLPLVDATDQQVETLIADLTAGGVEIPA
ncbi:4-hydroxy-tetrahydrodipicolinate synthase [Fodinicola acaciae]|uniref:4-hydroxy-tetrahydrodipicolinate synthase n=1 Tax=Fodinicola acaciae TaxID=2681555 RepID=UPI0013D3A5E7|nr:4-hydroxy-tetrahydrodipicolinate synthase [Fodinicola acaciae]